MTDDMKPKRDMDNALQSLRTGYEQTVDIQESQPEPIEGKELRERRFPKMMSYFVGGLAVGMLVMAVFLFSVQSRPVTEPTIVELDATVEDETAVVVDDVNIPPPPTPPIFNQSAVPPIPDDAIPLPPEPTPWPTPAIEP
ncbi:MAG: hypothetical protein DWQ04_29115 [Chloroflexi bacterium]|nr:MAG: hypothetical protein DWQ04_29115 [Chloroflexota bacterium]